MHDDYDEDEAAERDLERLKNFFGKHKFEVCPRCEGRGKHVNPAIDGHGLSAEDFDQDPDFREDYFSGVYDVPCYECKGDRVVKVPNWLALTPDECHAIHLHLEDEADYRALCRMEQQWEDRGYGGRYGY
jgi:hypothetical protein